MYSLYVPAYKLCLSLLNQVSWVHWKSSSVQFLIETLGSCSADHVRMCQSGTLAKAGLLPPSLFVPQPLEEGAPWRALPLDSRISCFHSLLGWVGVQKSWSWAAGRALKAVKGRAGDIAWEWKSCAGIPSSILHSNLLHSSQMSFRNLPRRNSCLTLKRGNIRKLLRY